MRVWGDLSLPQGGGGGVEGGGPMSRAAFEARFSDDAACAAHLFARRWPEGFVCPACGGAKGWELKGKRFTW